jgi:hypothetical protein
LFVGGCECAGLTCGNGVCPGERVHTAIEPCTCINGWSNPTCTPTNARELTLVA